MYYHHATDICAARLLAMLQLLMMLLSTYLQMTTDKLSVPHLVLGHLPPSGDRRCRRILVTPVPHIKRATYSLFYLLIAEC